MKKRLMSAGSRVRQHGVREYKERNRSSEYQTSKRRNKRYHCGLSLKDEFGEYKIPAIRQRPVLLIGPPGVGKTQIMEQIARECEIGLVAYTITHHTRQSAVGLPFIEHKIYGGKSILLQNIP